MSRGCGEMLSHSSLQHHFSSSRFAVFHFCTAVFRFKHHFYHVGFWTWMNCCNALVLSFLDVLLDLRSLFCFITTPFGSSFSCPPDGPVFYATITWSTEAFMVDSLITRNSGYVAQTSRFHHCGTSGTKCLG